jgi:hypothetical protein
MSHATSITTVEHDRHIAAPREQRLQVLAPVRVHRATFVHH